jgi:hypothetical protein
MIPGNFACRIASSRSCGRSAPVGHPKLRPRTAGFPPKAAPKNYTKQYYGVRTRLQIIIFRERTSVHLTPKRMASPQSCNSEKEEDVTLTETHNP